LGKENVQFFVQKDAGIVFRNREKKLQEEDMGQIEFTSNEDLYKKAVHGKCNTIFFKERSDITEFISYLRDVGEWCSVYIDEMAEVVPFGGAGEQWVKNERFGNILKDLRKCQIDLFYCSQAVSDIDFRTRSRVLIRVFLPGAYADRRCRVSQDAIDGLKRNPTLGNEAYISLAGNFGKIRVNDVFRPIKGLCYDAVVKETNSK